MSDLFKEYIEYIEEINRKDKEVRTRSYLNWVHDYVIKKGNLNDDAIYYTESESMSKTDIRNIELISAFFSYIECLYLEQYYPNTKQEVSINLFQIDERIYRIDEFGFMSFQACIKIKGNYFHVRETYGQGTLQSIRLMDKNDYECSLPYIELGI